ncbi:MAG: AAA family ATPase [Patescibacteria group bacterium]|nr:MAG: AAA family ATPase [Patescibacteria group bacterium]
MNKIIIGLVGEAASGKGTVAAYLLEKYRAKTLAFSTPMKDCLKRLLVPLSRENLTAFSEFTRKAYGEDLYARVVAEDAKNSEDALVVVDGIRRPADYANLKELSGFHLIYVTAPVELRWERARKRGEKATEATMTLEQFKQEELLPTELEIKAIGQKAEFIVDNSGKIEELYTSMESIVEYIKAGDFDHPHPHRNKIHPTL